MSEAQLLYRRLEHADLTRLADIDRTERIERLYVQHGTELEEVAGDFSAKPWYTEGDGPHSVAHQREECERYMAVGATALGAFDGERLVGIGIVVPNVRRAVAQLAYLHVGNGYRGRGIGARLTADLERLAYDAGAGTIVVSATPSENTVRFYRRRGYEPTANPLPELVELEPEDVHMEKRLTRRPASRRRRVDSGFGGRDAAAYDRRVPLLELETIMEAPKALLHDHLDGGLRPETVVELARDVGYRELPTSDPAELARWFTHGADRKSLELYLEGFRHTIALLQTREAIERVAAECAEDLAADNVVYAEVRYAPELSTEGGLTLDDVVTAILEGFREGERRARLQGRRIVMKLLVSAMRQAARSVEAAELAVRHRDEGVVGFDIAGPEAGFPPTRHLDAFQLIQRENFHVTIHAGESFGLPSIWEALQLCGAERLGHGVRIVDDITVRPDGSTELGRLAAFVRDRRVPLEMCPTCNVQTGAAASIEEHPIDLLRRLRYRVTVNTDNRLMSGVTMSSEFHVLAKTFGIGLDDMEWLTTNAMKSAFAPFDERLEIINEALKPGYARLRARQVSAGTNASVASV